jgi:hypothetical protein
LCARPDSSITGKRAAGRICAIPPLATISSASERPTRVRNPRPKRLLLEGADPSFLCRGGQIVTQPGHGPLTVFPSGMVPCSVKLRIGAWATSLPN